MSKRIFSDKQDQLPTSNILRTPNCYYHKQPITYFCTKKKCTLPLCNECLPIHRRQHINDKQIAMQGIIEFQKAQGDSLNAFAQRKGQIQNTQQQFKGKILDYRNKMVETIDKVLDRFFEDCLITDGNIDILKQIQERTSEIKGGSLKQLIRYYEDTYGAQHFRKLYKMYNGQYLTNFKFDINKPKIQQLTRQGIINLSLPYQNGKMAKTLVIKNDNNQQNFKQEVKQILEPVKNNGNNNEKKLNYLVNNQNRQFSTEQDLQSEISSYKLLKTKKGSMGQNEPNIYTQQISKVAEPLSSIPSSNESHASRSKSKKKKGLSLTKSHAFLTLQSDNSLKDQNDRNQQNLQRRQNWRNFVNMGQIHPHQKSQERLMNQRQQVSEPKTLLNPKQMRELIVKKKMQQKNRSEKQIRSNKSRELIDAVSSKNLRP